MRYLIATVGAVVVTFAVIVVVYVVGFRTKNATILRGVRGVNRVLFNPQQMKSAGTAGAYASIVRHRGRTTGTRYETPIVVREYGDDLVTVLPYGTQADWIKNVLAAGEAQIVSEGREWNVDQPRLVDTDDLPDLMTAKDDRMNGFIGITDAVRFRRQLIGSSS